MTKYTWVLLIAVVQALPGVAAAQHTGCRGADTATMRILEYVKDQLREPDEWTDSLGLTSVDSLSIVSETDSTACVRVAHVVDSVFERTVVEPFVVVRAGSRFFAYSPSNDPQKPSELLHVVDDAFVYRKTIVY